MKNEYGDLSGVIQTIYILNLVSNYMFLLNLSLSCKEWDMEIPKMVSWLKSSLPFLYTCVSLASVSDMLASVFSSQMRLFPSE
jgi:hypothetical protein